MHALAAFFFATPAGRYVGIALSVICVVLWLRWDAASNAVSDYSAKITAAFSQLMGKAGGAQSTVENCPLEKWNRETGKCDK